MIVFLTGVPGSGKSAFAVHYLLKHNSLKAKDSQLCHTNINQLDLEKLSNVRLLEKDINNNYMILDNIKTLHTLYKTKCSDDELIEKAKTYGLYKCAIIIDECHNLLDHRSPAYVWWLSYHRHLHQEIILITQNLSLIDSKYKAFAEWFYRAKRTSLQLFSKNFVYDKFVDSRMAFKSRVGTIKVKKSEELFNLYKSGDNVETQNVLKKYLLISFFIFVPLLGFGYYFIHNMGKTTDSTNLNSHNSVSSTVKNVSNTMTRTVNNLSRDVYSYVEQISIHCFDEQCSIRGHDVPFSYIKNYIIQSGSEITNIQNNMRLDYVYLQVMATQKLLDHFPMIEDTKDDYIAPVEQDSILDDFKLI